MPSAYQLLCDRSGGRGSNSYAWGDRAAGYWRFQVCLLLLRAVLAGLILICSKSADAHGKRYLWEMTASELRALEIRLDSERNVLQQAFAKLGTPLAHRPEGQLTALGEQNDVRPLASTELLAALRSAQNALVELEVGSMRKYLFCRSGPACGVRSQTLFTSLVGRSQLSEDEAERQISLLSASFPETENRFRALANDFFNAVKLRWQNRQRYLVSLRSGLSYGSQAFGPLSVTAGAVAFGITFTAVELLESLTLGPLHWVCQANWFWAASIGLTVAGFSRDLKGWLSKASSARVTWTSFLDWRAARMVARDPGLFIADQSADFEAVRYHDGLRKLTQADPIGFGVRSWMNRDELLWSLQVREILQRSAGSEVRLARHKIGWDGRPALDIDRLEFDQLVDRLSKPLEVQTQTAILRALLRSEVDRALLQAQLQTVAVTRSGEKRVPQHHQVKTWIKRLGQLDHGLRLMELRQTKQVKFQEELGLSKETSFPEEIQTWIENLWEAESAPSTTARQCASAF